MNAADEIRLRHMRDAALDARRFATGKSRGDLETEKMMAYAILQALQIIGESATQVSDETRQQHPQIAWKNITGMRHRLVHDYEHVNYDVVWQVIAGNLPVLIEQLDAILAPPESDDVDML